MFLGIGSDLVAKWLLSGIRTDKMPLGLHDYANLGTIWGIGGFLALIYLSDFAKTCPLGFRLDSGEDPNPG